ncbi:MAG: shikimate dehydrogenase [Nitrosopumilus sp.]|nr:shikimate dehydrogenase [Nitrosopumilus sp.]
MLCIVINGPTLQDVYNQIVLATKYHSLVELRLDLIENLDLDELKLLRNTFPISMIFTLRPTSLGGNYSGSENERQSLIKKLATLKPNYFDLESFLPISFIKEFKKQNPEIKIIFSFNDFEKMPILSNVLEEMYKTPADFYKIAVKVNSSAESLSLLDFMKNHGPNLSIIGIGEFGIVTQILSPIFGGVFSYACLDSKQRTIWELLTIDELLNLYNYNTLSVNTSIYGVIGNPLDKSLGPTTYNPLMKFFNIPAVYVKFPVTGDQLKEFLDWAKKIGIMGLSVTMPLKEQVIPYLNEIDSWANRIKSVNHLILKGEKIESYNTDGKGALSAIENQMLVKNKRIVLLGAGGAGKAIAAEAVDRGAQVIILDLNEGTAKKLGELLGCESGGMVRMEVEYKRGYDILINATPSQLPIDPKFIKTHSFVMDVSMKPILTALLQEAKKRGCLLVHGDEMFVNQALIQSEHWFGDKIDLEKSREIMKNSLLENKSEK